MSPATLLELEILEFFETRSSGMEFMDVARELFGPEVFEGDERAAYLAGWLASLVMGQMLYASRVAGLPDRYFLAPEGKRFVRQNRVFSRSSVQEGL